LIENKLIIRMSNHEDVMSNLQFFNVQFDVVAHFIKVHVVINMKDQTKSRFKAHDYFHLVHQSFDDHINFRFWIHQFNDFDDVFNDNLCFKKFTNISLFLSFLPRRSRSDRIDMKYDNDVFRKNFREDFMSKWNKNDNFDQRKNDLSTF
jgi:hypothetical protein